MIRLVTRLGMVVYLRYLFKANSKAFKKIISALIIIIFSMFIYYDLRDLLREIDSSYLPHLLILRWVLIFSLILFIFRRISELKLSEKILFKMISVSDDAKPELKEKVQEIEDRQEIKDGLKKYRNIEKFPKLKTAIDEILK